MPSGEQPAFRYHLLYGLISLHRRRSKLKSTVHTTLRLPMPVLLQASEMTLLAGRQCRPQCTRRITIPVVGAAIILTLEHHAGQVGGRNAHFSLYVDPEFGRQGTVKPTERAANCTLPQGLMRHKRRRNSGPQDYAAHESSGWCLGSQPYRCGVQARCVSFIRSRVIYMTMAGLESFPTNGTFGLAILESLEE